LEQRFERTESNHIVCQFGGERCFLDLVEPGFFFGRNCGDEERDFCPQSLPWHVVGHDRIDALHQDRAHLFLYVVPDALVGVEADLTGRGELKEKVRAILMQRIDPVVANTCHGSDCGQKITLLVSAIATEEKAGLNEIEENSASPPN